MAAEKDLELLDNYLANKLGVEERSAFEQKLNTDLDLKSEFDLQQEFVRGIKKARMGELKSMLNSIPVPAGPTSGVAVGAKVAMWVVAIGVIGTGLYFYFDDEKPTMPASETQIQQPEQGEKPEIAKGKAQIEPETSNDEAPVVSEEPSSSEQKPVQSPKAIKKDTSGAGQSSEKRPLDVYDPTKETEENPSLPGHENMVSKERTSIAVDVDSENKKYNFHYQFKQGKLILYGPFEKNLYEIMEFFTDDKRTLFLYYNDQYFLLKEENGSGNLKALSAIKDPELLKKLKEYRK